MQQIARNVTMDGCGALRDCRYLLHDRDAKYSAAFRAIIETTRVKRSVKDECLSKIIFFGERSLRRAVHEYVAHYHSERNHQGKSNVLLFPRITETRGEGPVRCRERLGGLLRYYHQDAA
jgi:putative transposase